MQTRLTETIKQGPYGEDADRILRNCVHCGFCTAVCPTYQLLGDELDGPRGRLYQIKQILEGDTPSATTLQHLDRCLTCRSCETTCPSGVDYARLLDIGRHQAELAIQRPLSQRLFRWALTRFLPQRSLFSTLLQTARLFKPLLPSKLKRQIPVQKTAGSWPAVEHSRQMVILKGCVQPALAPDIDAATARLLDRLGIQLISIDKSQCCGAINHHLNETERAQVQARHNIDQLMPYLDRGAEAIVSTASGCGAMLKDYGHLLKDDPDYAEKAERVASLVKDLVEIVSQETLPPLAKETVTERIAFHPPCTLQHGQGLSGKTEAILKRAGFTLTAINNAHLCCGSAGTYSLLQPELSQQLRHNKRNDLLSDKPDVIATANIGCMNHLTDLEGPPVVHWVTLLDSALSRNSIQADKST